MAVPKAGFNIYQLPMTRKMVHGREKPCIVRGFGLRHFNDLYVIRNIPYREGMDLSTVAEVMNVPEEGLRADGFGERSVDVEALARSIWSGRPYEIPVKMKEEDPGIWLRKESPAPGLEGHLAEKFKAILGRVCDLDVILKKPFDLGWALRQLDSPDHDKGMLTVRYMEHLLSIFVPDPQDVFQSSQLAAINSMHFTTNTQVREKINHWEKLYFISIVAGVLFPKDPKARSRYVSEASVELAKIARGMPVNMLVGWLSTQIYYDGNGMAQLRGQAPDNYQS